MKSGIWKKLQSNNKNDKNPADIGVTVVSQDFILQGDKASGGLQRCADVLCHAKHDAHLAASTPRRT